MHVLDTNAVIYYLKGDARAISVLEPIFLQDSPLFISTITEAELFGFSSLTEKEIKSIETIHSTLSIIPIDSHLARLAGFIRREYHLKLPDCFIASTALFTNSVLLTRNARDFEGLSN